ncbi:glycoside hydrolase family 76 protein [Aspergillus clavatus NRRL 1]|uniref:Mannan endo-1,6-alpha-mannosidase n=1 Tax=Aspergillus clavatus (strain ATCC 1007 / CBS 513.65 / DSM 816 / NCTC 3887 / NRRL 1 / QM 1276 / 107) TaxID=344612 RepID=A1CLW4_ASPCL|nr:cell wall glycosyl hydrolase Dfg5, putative [Aspergillus clavatus NRRL 1]EAW09093.1 cell wall glycosyl hydrolase Dfg5, putative [Aspergillus clavatus NRRL 1]
MKLYTYWSILPAVHCLQLDVDNPASIKQAAHDVARNMLSHYTGMNPGDNPGNLPDPYYWWEAGAMFNALIDYWYLTGDEQWNKITMQALTWQAGDTGTFMPTNQTKTEGNDDQAFWAFAAMSAAERNFPNPARGPGWLAMAQAVFNTQAARWDAATCGGGLRWQIFSFNNGWNYKNTISNGCFFHLAARLARYTGNTTYAEWATRVWDWTMDVGFVTDDWRFMDGADVLDGCSEFNRIQWTYNSGVYLLGAATMYNITADSRWRDITANILQATDAFFTGGVMFERACETVDTCQTDQRAFKGFLARWMAATMQMAPFTADWVLPRLRASAAAAARTCTGGVDGAACGLKWTEQRWDGSEDVGLQMSALEVMQATLIGSADAPLTDATGGTSQGDPEGGAGPASSRAKVLTREITRSDHAGAGILTVMLAAVVTGTTGWLVYE